MKPYRKMLNILFFNILWTILYFKHRKSVVTKLRMIHTVLYISDNINDKQILPLGSKYIEAMRVLSVMCNM